MGVPVPRVLKENKLSEVQVFSLYSYIWKIGFIKSPEPFASPGEQATQRNAVHNLHAEVGAVLQSNVRLHSLRQWGRPAARASPPAHNPSEQ